MIAARLRLVRRVYWAPWLLKCEHRIDGGGTSPRLCGALLVGLGDEPRLGPASPGCLRGHDTSPGAVGGHCLYPPWSDSAPSRSYRGRQFPRLPVRSGTPTFLLGTLCRVRRSIMKHCHATTTITDSLAVGTGRAYLDSVSHQQKYPRLRKTPPRPSGLDDPGQDRRWPLSLTKAGTGNGHRPPPGLVS